MGKYLDEIMLMSDKGYIDSFNDIEKLTEKVMNMNARSLIVSDGYKPDTIVDDLIIFNDLPDGCSYEVRVCDMLNMAYELGYGEHADTDDCACERYTAIIAELLNKAAGTSAEIKLFLSISVKALADFMDKKSKKNKHKCRKIYETIIEMAKENALFEVTEKTTVRAVINGVRPYMTKWGPRMRARTFINYAENCCDIIKKIFIDFMCEGYKDMFDFSKLREAFIKQQEQDDLEFKEYMEQELFDTDDDKAAGIYECEQLCIEFQPLSADNDDGSDKESDSEWNKLFEMLNLLHEKK